MKKTLLLVITVILSISNMVAQSLTVTSIDTNPAEVDSDVTLNYEYTNSNPNDIIYIGLELLNSDGSWSATIAETTVNPVGASGTDVSGSAIVSIPNTATPSADLTGGQYYRFKVELNMEAWAGWLAGDYPTMTLAAAGTLAIEDFSSSSIAIYPNPVSDILTVKMTNLSAENNSYKIVSILGKVVLKASSENLESINVSNLSQGLYFLKIGNLNPVKFLKK